VTDYLQAYATEFGAPIRTGVDVSQAQRKTAT